NSFGARRDGRFDEQRVNVSRRPIDVDEDGRRTAVCDRIGGGNKRVTDGDPLVTSRHTDGEQRQVQSGRAVRDGAGVSGAYNLRELALERSDFWSLGDPA